MAAKQEETPDKLKEDEYHPTHSIEWCGPDKKSYTITCDKAQTVEGLLMQSQQFKKTAEKFQNKELVIVLATRAISSHFPCSLVKDERLTVKYIKATDEQKAAAGFSSRSCVKAPSQEVLKFHLWVNGGKGIARIMRNPDMKTEVQDVTVFAYKGENVRYALKRDGRFQDVIFKKTCALQKTSTEVFTEMSNLVDTLDDQTFKVVLLSRSSPPDSQPSDSEDVSDSEQSDDDETSPPQPTAAQIKTETVEPQSKTTVKNFYQVPESKEIRKELQLQFRRAVGTESIRVPTLSRVQNLLRVKYGQNDAICREVKTMKKLMELSDSVCHVRSDGKPLGSGFLLFGKFVLTNGRVVNQVGCDIAGKLAAPVTVTFSFEDLNDVQGRQVEEEIVGYEFQASAPIRDWALLKLKDELNLPNGLLSHSGFVPQGGGICIIGHPDSRVKSIDTCVIVAAENRRQVVEKHKNDNLDQVQMITSRFFENVDKFFQENKEVLTYETCFYYGSSGSPVFDRDCRVVAMHTGGYIYEGVRAKPQSVIEYGQPLSVILERIVVQTVERERFDVLEELMGSSGVEQQVFVSFVAKLIRNDHLGKFQNKIRLSLDKMDERLREIFKKALKEAEGVPMDIDSA